MRTIAIIVTLVLVACAPDTVPMHPPLKPPSAEEKQVGACTAPDDVRRLLANEAGNDARYCGCVDPSTVGPNHQWNRSAEECATRSFQQHRSFYIVRRVTGLTDGLLAPSFTGTSGTASASITFFTFYPGSPRAVPCRAPVIEYGRWYARIRDSSASVPPRRRTSAQQALQWPRPAWQSHGNVATISGRGPGR